VTGAGEGISVEVAAVGIADGISVRARVVGAGEGAGDVAAALTNTHTKMNKETFILNKPSGLADVVW
jgi:hypothetical protein